MTQFTTPPVVDRVGAVLAALATGLFCYMLARWLGYLPGEAVKAEDLLLPAVLALLMVGGVLKKRHRLISLIARIGAGVGLVVLLWLRFA